MVRIQYAHRAYNRRVNRISGASFVLKKEEYARSEMFPQIPDGFRDYIIKNVR